MIFLQIFWDPTKSTSNIRMKKTKLDCANYDSGNCACAVYSLVCLCVRMSCDLKNALIFAYKYIFQSDVQVTQNIIDTWSGLDHYKLQCEELSNSYIH